jgi:hypothetical protein
MKNKFFLKLGDNKIVCDVTDVEFETKPLPNAEMTVRESEFAMKGSKLEYKRSISGKVTIQNVLINDVQEEGEDLILSLRFIEPKSPDQSS